MSLTKQQAEAQLKKAKEFLDSGIIDQQEFAAVKDECLPIIGLRKANKVTPATGQSKRSSASFIAALRRYEDQKTGDWTKQSPAHVLGYLLDFRPPDVTAQTIEMFIHLFMFSTWLF